MHYTERLVHGFGASQSCIWTVFGVQWWIQEFSQVAGGGERLGRGVGEGRGLGGEGVGLEGSYCYKPKFLSKQGGAQENIGKKLDIHSCEACLNFVLYVVGKIKFPVDFQCQKLQWWSGGGTLWTTPWVNPLIQFAMDPVERVYVHPSEGLVLIGHPLLSQQYLQQGTLSISIENTFQQTSGIHLNTSVPL